MPFGSLSTTSPVVLKPINTDGEANDSYTEVSSNVQQSTFSETLKYGIQNPRMHNILPRVELLPLTDIRNWNTDIAVVWETHQPCHQEQTLASVPHSTSNEVEQSQNSMFTGEENREIVVMLHQTQTINQLHQILDDIPGFDRASPFLSWAERTPIHDLTEFCNQVQKELLSKGGNGYIATYNPLLSYLTGSHITFPC